MISILLNPKTSEYLSLKEKLNGSYIPWFYHPSSTSDEMDGYTNNPIYQHMILEGPNPNNGSFIPVPKSELIGLCEKVIGQIFQSNEISAKHIHRICANVVHYYDGIPSVPHVDHEDIVHKNMVIYLNSFTKGEIEVSGSLYKPMEDDIITFTGYHSVHQPGPGDRRVVLVATYS